MENKDQLKAILEEGSKKARVKARQNLAEAREAMRIGFITS